MNDIDVVLVMLLGVVASHWLARALGDRIAMPLVQIATGAAIGLATGVGRQLHPDLFFLLFLPPLLFLDGWRVSREDLRENMTTILSLAVGLVFFTVLGVGLLLHAMIPSLPLSVSFALAAVLSPTDVVAATAMMQNVAIPTRLLRILQGEALFNDASGLVCLRFAVSATLTGAFSLWDSIAAFAWIAVAGIAIGLATTWVVTTLKIKVADRWGENTSSQILISLLTPFGAYLLAEHLGCSGVLSAVAAGMMMSEMEINGRTLAITRVRRSTIWDTVQFTLNGVIFLLLGAQVPHIVTKAFSGTVESGHVQPWWLAVYTLVITVALFALRFVWVWITVTLPLVLRRVPGHALQRPSWRLVAAMSAAGVRGTITLAGALSLPLTLGDGSPFPARDLVIFLAGSAIIASLLLSNLLLPVLLRNVRLPAEPNDDAAEGRARKAAADAALAAITATNAQGQPAENAIEAAACVADFYQRRLRRLRPTVPSAPARGQDRRAEGHLHVAALKAERQVIVQMVHNHEIRSDLAQKLLRELDLREAQYEV
ncbi:Na+/H+ antiporter [Azorhizobium sp. AG788]|uniref:Na+/H+ antiporter n=1 Tax=Azorhizobium sp. AG788 TaxID=2183897 RepID=UPI00313A2A3B